MKKYERCNEMLDTVILNIPWGSFTILDDDKFHPSTRILHMIGVGYMAFYNNPTAAEKRDKIYRPLLTLYKRGKNYELKIQFSAAKLLFRNNLEEFGEGQFEEVLDALQRSLRYIGVSVGKEVLRHAYVASFHPSKNIPIIGGYRATDIVGQIAKVCVTGKLDIDTKDFRNGGHGVQLRAETHTLTFYDKGKDLSKGDSKSYDYEKNQKMQRENLLDFMNQKRLPEILRMEARLCDRVKMKSVLEQVGFPMEKPTFAAIFKEDICRAVLLYYFETYIEPNFFIFDYDDSPQAILKGVIRKNKKMKIGKAMKLAHIKSLCKDEGGSRGFRDIIEQKFGRREWQRIAAEIKGLNRKIPLKSCHSYMKDIKQALQKFKPYKPEIAKKLSTSHVKESKVSSIP